MSCRAPGCTNRADLICHHVILRSEGGATQIANEVALCESCHSRVHEGLLQVNGDTSEGLEWLDSDGEILSRFEAGLGGVRLAVELTRPARTPRGASEEENVLRSLDEIPDHIDSAWWKKYSHNLEFRNGRLCLRSSR